MNYNNQLSKQAKPQEFELIKLLFREYIRSHIARPDIEYSFQARFQSFINQIPSYLHSSSKTGFFTHFFFGSFASLLDTKLAQKLDIQKLHFNFDQINHLRIVAETSNEIHVFIFTEDNQDPQNQKKKINFTKDEWKTITGQEYTDNDNKKLEINVININKSTGSANVAVEKKSIQDGASTKQYHEITKQFVDDDGQYIALEDQILQLSVGKTDQSEEALKLILRYTKKIHDHYAGLPYGAGAKEADEHGFVAGIFNNFRYRENVHVYLEQFAGKGYVDIVLLVRGADRAIKSIPIIIELKAGTATGTNADDALRQVKEYTNGFQPNNMRILSLSDHVLCVGMNLDIPTDSFIKTQVVARNQVVAPLIQCIIDSVQKIKEDDNLSTIKQEIQSFLKETYNTFPGTGEKSSAHYMSRFILGESLVLRDYDKHIFIYDKESYIPTNEVINVHGTRLNKKAKIEKIKDGSNAVNSILFIPISSANSPAILVNIIDVNRDVVVNNVRLDSGLIGNRKIVQLNIQFNINKYQKSFSEYCNIKLLKIYNSISKYNEGSIQVKGKLHLIAEDISDNLLEHLQQAISSQKGLVISERYYKELMRKVGEVVYPIKSLIAKESEFQGLLEGIFKYYSDVKLSEGSERRELVLTEFQTGAGGRIDMLVHAISTSEQGTKEYIPVGLELKYSNSIKLDTFAAKQDQDIQQILLIYKEKQVIEKLLTDQIKRYTAGAAIKSITDSNQVAIMGVVFNAQAKNADSLLLTTDQLTHATVIHSSKLYTISDINDKHDQLQERLIIHSNSIIMEYYDKIDIHNIYNLLQILSREPYVQKITISDSEITNDAMTRLSNILEKYNKITSISFINTNIDKEKAEILINLLRKNNHIVYLDVTSNNNLDIETQNQLNNVLHHNQRIHQKIKSIFPLHTVDDMSSNVFIPDWVNIRRDQMRDNNIIVQNSDDIDRCYQDTALDLSNTMLEDSTINQVVTWLTNHKDVDFLDLSNNQLSSIGAEKILDYLTGNQNKISLLDISENYIGTNSQAIIKLASLIRHNNDVHGPVLKFLNFQNIGINHGDVSNIFRALIENTSIEHLDMSSNNLFFQIDELSIQYITNDIAHVLYNHPVLSTLDLSNTGLTNLVIHNIVRLRKIYPQKHRAIHITELNIAGNYITQDGIESLRQLILSAQQLQSLDISNNRIGTLNINTLLNTLIHTKISTLRMSNIDLNNDYNIIGNVIKHSNIQNFDISHNNIGTTAVINIFQGISYKMENNLNNNLIQLNLSGNRIGQDYTIQETVISAMISALKNNQVLRSLDISDMNIEDYHLSELLNELTKSNIENLNIAGNDISEHTILALESYLLSKAPLKLLNISGYNDQEYQSLLRSEDIYFLFEGLSGNSKLTHLDLSRNNLDYESIKIISEYLKKNQNLEYLSLAYNNLSIDSIYELFQGLSINSQLQYLDISNNHEITDYHALKILEILKVNKGLKILYISNHNLSKHVISEFTKESLDIIVEFDEHRPPKVNPRHRHDNLLDLDYQTFESETALQKYNYWLQQYDIVDIGRVWYGFSANGLEVTGSIDQLSRVINGYKSNNNNISPFTIICNIGNDNKGSNHWFSLVLNRQDTNYHGYYIDSFGRSIPANIARILNSYKILIVPISITQQTDGHNCGLWALENAQKICQVLQNNANTDLGTNSFRDMLISSRSATEWRHIRDNILKQLQRDDIRTANLNNWGLSYNPVESPNSIISTCLSSISRVKREIKQGCRIGWDDVDKFNSAEQQNRRSVDEIKIDSKKFLEYSKNIHDKNKNIQLLQLAKECIIASDNNIVGEYKYLLHDVMQDGGYNSYLKNEHIQDLARDFPNSHLGNNYQIKQKLFNAAGKIQLIRGIHSTIDTCQDGSAKYCALSVSGLGYSFLSQPIEKVMVKITPKIITQTSELAGNFMPRVLGYNTKIVIQISGMKYGVKIAKGSAGALIGIFDIIDIAISSNALVECANRKDSNEPCSNKEIRDNIASITFASVSFIAGVGLTIAGAPLVATGVGFVLMVGYGVYSGISTIIEYEKYDTTNDENWHLFWYTLFLQGPPSELQHLADRQNFVDQIVTNAWTNLQDSPDNIVAYGTGLGKVEYKTTNCRDICYDPEIPCYYPISKCDYIATITAHSAAIHMHEQKASIDSLSRVLPQSIQNTTMVCLPKITDADYEKGIIKSVPTARYYCDNAVVIVHNQRKSLENNDQWIIYNLRYVDTGIITGSRELRNIFILYKGDPEILCGNNTTNKFIFLSDEFFGHISLGKNSTNIFDVTQLTNKVVNFKFIDSAHGVNKRLLKLILQSHLLDVNYFNFYDYTNLHYVGRKDKVDNVVCTLSSYDLSGEHQTSIFSISVDGRGGYSNAQKDTIYNCSKVIVRPFTEVTGRVYSTYTFDIKTTGYETQNSSSIIDVHGNSTIVFSEISLLKDCDHITYSPVNNTISFIIPLSPQGTFTLDVKNYLDRYNNTNFILIDRDGSNIVPKLSNNSTVVEKFELYARYPFNNTNRGDYKVISQTDKDYQVFSIITNTLNDTQMLLGSSSSDVINLNEQIVFAEGGEGQDVYVFISTPSKQNYRIVYINNKAEDRKFDILIVHSIDNIVLKRHPYEDGLSVFIMQQVHNSNTIGAIIIVENYFLGHEYQHLILVDKDHNSFIPFKSNKDVILVPFYCASSGKNVFILPVSAKQVVINNNLEDIAFYRDRNDLLLLEQDTAENSIPLVVILKDFYSNLSKWQDYKIYYYNNNNGNYYYIDLVKKTFEVINYTTHQYASVVKEYIVDFSKSVEIYHNHNYNGTITTFTPDAQRIGVMILRNISPNQIEVCKNGSDVILNNKNSNHTVSIKHWSISNSYKMSILEFSLGLNVIKIHQLDREDSNDSNYLKNKLDYASLLSSNKIFLLDADVAHNLRCILSASSMNIDKAYVALGFTSLHNQINFLQNCDVMKFESIKLKHNIHDLLSEYKNKLLYDLELSNYNHTEINYYHNLIHYKLFYNTNKIIQIMKDFESPIKDFQNQYGNYTITLNPIEQDTIIDFHYFLSQQKKKNPDIKLEYIISKEMNIHILMKVNYYEDINSEIANIALTGIKFVVTIKLENISQNDWYKNLHIFLSENTPMRINCTNLDVSLVPMPKDFRNYSKSIVITEDGIEWSINLMSKKTLQENIRSDNTQNAYELIHQEDDDINTESKIGLEVNLHHKHRHHHGEEAVHYRGRRDIDNFWHVFTKDGNHDNDDYLLGARDDILEVSSAGSSSTPWGYNIVNWISNNILLTFKNIDPLREVKNLWNVYNDKTQTITYDLDISDNVGCKKSQKQDSLVNKFSIVQEINDQICELVEKKVAAKKLLQELCQKLNSVEKEILRQEELEDSITNIYQKEEGLAIKYGDLQDQKQELYHLKEQIELQKFLIESLRSELNSLNQKLAMLNVKGNNLSLHYELPYWNESLENDVEVDDDIADQLPIWMISSNHHINVGNLSNSFIGNDTDKHQVLDDSLCDFQGTLSLWNLLMRKKYGVHYNHQHDIMQSEGVNTEYAHRLAYTSYAPSIEKQEEDIELVGMV